MDHVVTSMRRPECSGWRRAWGRRLGSTAPWPDGTSVSGQVHAMWASEWCGVTPPACTGPAHLVRSRARTGSGVDPRSQRSVAEACGPNKECMGLDRHTREDALVALTVHSRATGTR